MTNPYLPAGAACEGCGSSKGSCQCGVEEERPIGLAILTPDVLTFCRTCGHDTYVTMYGLCAKCRSNKLIF